MTTLMTRLALATLLALPMAGGGIALPARADDPIDFVCYDREIGNGKTEIVCEPADIVAKDCEVSDPDGEGAECAAVQESRPPRNTPTFTFGGTDGGGGGSQPVGRLRG